MVSSGRLASFAHTSSEHFPGSACVTGSPGSTCPATTLSLPSSSPVLRRRRSRPHSEAQQPPGVTAKKAVEKLLAELQALEPGHHLARVAVREVAAVQELARDLPLNIPIDPLLGGEVYVAEVQARAKGA